VSFESFSEPPISTLVAEAGATRALTLLIGAGASMEAGLPSWETLVGRLLLRSARERDLIEQGDPGAAERWKREALRDGYLGAAAIVDALAGDRRDAWIREELFAPAGGPEEFFPGPISRQVPVLARAFGTDCGS
jgi:hypothetical protein